MTKKDYQIIASVINDIISGGALCMDNEEDCRDFVRQFAEKLQAENPRFNREIFAKACGVEDIDKQRDNY